MPKSSKKTSSKLSDKKYIFSQDHVTRAEQFILNIDQSKKKKLRHRVDDSFGLLGKTNFHCNTIDLDIAKHGLGYNPCPTVVIPKLYSSLSYRAHIKHIINSISRHDWNNALKLIRYIFKNKQFRSKNKNHHRLYSKTILRALIIVVMHHPDIDKEIIYEIIRVILPKNIPELALKCLLEKENNETNRDSANSLDAAES